METALSLKCEMRVAHLKDLFGWADQAFLGILPPPYLLTSLTLMWTGFRGSGHSDLGGGQGLDRRVAKGIQWGTTS